MNACKNKLKLDGRVVDFVLPLLISINRNGSAMFVIVSLCFIANSSAFIFGAGDVVAMWQVFLDVLTSGNFLPVHIRTSPAVISFI